MLFASRNFFVDGFFDLFYGSLLVTEGQELFGAAELRYPGLVGSQFLVQVFRY